MSCFPSQPALACFLIIVFQLEPPSFQQPLATLYRPSVQIAIHTFATQARRHGQDNFLKVKLKNYDNEICRKGQIISNWFLEHDNGFNVLHWPPQSPDPI